MDTKEHITCTNEHTDFASHNISFTTLTIYNKDDYSYVYLNSENSHITPEECSTIHTARSLIYYLLLFL